MRLIFSRKGFDSSAGGCANALLPDGTLLPFPIPDPDSPLTYADLRHPDVEPAALIRDLTRGKVLPGHGAHLDPDLDAAALAQRPRGWRPLFGQAGAAQRHLLNQGVQVGDLFLFYSWFRPVDHDGSRYRFTPRGADEHLLYGWFQIGSIHQLGGESRQRVAGLNQHPHAFGTRGSLNVVYRASSRLVLPGLAGRMPGAGQWRTRCAERVLTEAGRSRGRWLLPGWFHPEGRASVLSYHADPNRWQRFGDLVRLQNVHRGQEFVLSCDDYPEAFPWLVSLFTPAP
ncbi:Nmad3 family putative nucleotide modification protein [Acanthopleuribacter pedis]|uniref:Nucleotide modification associated domain-containing protein n=1 Tax=Acanthopleuribacter pedis TaxID=442870 RepID=A0A8J7QAW4_9BACT|nr:hypothetical protein [Acanthopleuribacter pedis]MBO1320269.1 hypothetical protein [Acanthopleuribacter pedis]